MHCIIEHTLGERRDTERLGQVFRVHRDLIQLFTTQRAVSLFISSRKKTRKFLKRENDSIKTIDILVHRLFQVVHDITATRHHRFSWFVTLPATRYSSVGCFIVTSTDKYR